MAACYTDQSNATAAEEAWRKAIAGHDHIPDWHFRLGKILWDRGAQEEAITHLSKSIDLSKDRKLPPVWLWNAHFLLGEALRGIDPQRALTAYREFLRLSSIDNAYRADAEQAIAELEGKAPSP
jgi:tetratricopeptide (TPR) repeat protein